GGGRGQQFLAAGIDAAEGGLDALLQGGGRLATALGPETAPVETVIPVLRRVVVNGAALRDAVGRGDDRLELHVGIGRARHGLVEIVDVGLVMLAVVDAERVGGDHRVQCVVGVGQGGQVERATG